MKAILLAGGKGTRLRPLTIHTPKPIVPIFNRPFLHYQIDLLKQVSETEVRFTIYPGVGHDSWTQTYANPQLYEWLLQHKTRKK